MSEKNYGWLQLHSSTAMVFMISLISGVNLNGLAFEGTPSPEILDGIEFVGSITEDGMSFASKERISCSSGKLYSVWAKKLGFDAMKWDSPGEISGDSKSQTLFLSISAKNDTADKLDMRITVTDLKHFVAQVNFLKADGTKHEYAVRAEKFDLVGVWTETEDIESFLASVKKDAKLSPEEEEKIRELYPDFRKSKSWEFSADGTYTRINSVKKGLNLAILMTQLGGTKMTEQQIKAVKLELQAKETESESGKWEKTADGYVISKVTPTKELTKLIGQPGSSGLSIRTEEGKPVVQLLPIK